MSQFTSDQESISKILDYNVSRIQTAIPAVVLSFDADKQTVNVKIPFQETYETIEGDEVEEWGEVHDVPVVFSSGGSASITFPINKNDSVLLVCSCRSIDEWYESDGVQITEPLSLRNHDISDAFAVPGIRPLSKKLDSDSVDSDKLILKNGSSKIEVKTGAEINAICSRLNIGSDSASTPLTNSNILKTQIDTMVLKIDALGAILGLPPLVLIGDIKSTKAFTND